MRKLLFTIPFLLLMTGCAPQGWVMTDAKNHTVVGQQIAVTFPNGWMQTKLPQAMLKNKKGKFIPMETLTASRDGIGLQTITAAKRFNKFAFPSIEKQLRTNMLPSEVADLYVSDLRKQSGLERLKVLSNKPAKIGRKSGFHVVTSYRNDDGLRLILDTYGFADKTGLYLISYTGPYLYYYKRDHKDFVRTAQTFYRLKKATGEVPKMGLAGMFVAK
ncbi:MAG: hypothetical protein ACWGOV_11255 [Acidiferrobacterales bacterium]